MYEVLRKTRQFDLDNEEHLKDYDAIMNNPLCSVVKEIKEKITEKFFNEEGGLLSTQDKIALVVTWEEKSLL